MQKFKMATKNARKTIFEKTHQVTLWILWDQKFCQNLSISYQFRDKCVFGFPAEIQDGCPKWRKDDCQKKALVNGADTLRGQNFRRENSILYCLINAINAF